MSNELNILLSFAMITLLANSWYISFKLAPTIARRVLLVFNTILFSYFSLRILGYILYFNNIFDTLESRTYNQYIILVLCLLPISQQLLQRTTIIDKMIKKARNK